MTKAINKRRAPDKNTEIVFEYLEKFPEAPSKTLARKIHAEKLLKQNCGLHIHAQCLFYYN